MTWTGLLSMVLLLTLAFGAAAQDVRTGTRADEVVIVEVPSSEQAVSRLAAGALDVYAYSVSNAALFEQVRANPALDYAVTFGSYNEITFNTVGPEFNDGRLNPFHSRKIREAMNWLVDREYIAQEIYAGLAEPKYTVLNPAFADYARVVEKMRELEVKYGYDLGKAEEVVNAEMQAMGATKVNGKWHYKGQPVVLNFVIRIEDERQAIGEYVSSQLEKIGFAVNRDFKASADASAIWLSGDPWLGQWNAVTGGWLSPVVYRDQTHNFDQMYTRRVMPYPPFQALNPIPELDQISERLLNKDFSTMDERNELLERILELGFEDSPRIYIVDSQSFIPRRAEVSIAADLGGGVSGTLLWAPTLRRGEEIGGQFTIGLPSVLNEPWNPIAGSNSTYDQMPIRATMERSIIVDPYTGNYWANRLEKADIYVKEGLPVSASLDWVNLNFVEENVVPEDAWVDWDAKEQRFITAAEKFPEGVTALVRNVNYFPADFFETVKWHDGSPISVADIVFDLIIGFDRGKRDSAIFDESDEDTVRSELEYFRGFKILSTDPLVIESYTNTWNLDAEFNYGEWFPVDINVGPIAWHNTALGVLAETNRELAFSSAKANQLQVDQAAYHTGPSLAILNKYLQQAKADGYIPYANVLSQYITPEEAAARYANLEKWYAERGHFWIGTGVMYLDRVYPVEKMVVLKRNPNHPDSADKWAMFGEPMIPEIEVVSAGRLRVSRGTEASFDVAITFDGEPYLNENLEEVKFLIQDSRGNVVTTGPATAIGEGLYRVELMPSQTRELPIGSNRIDVIVVSKLVGGAKFASATFVTTP